MENPSRKKRRSKKKKKKKKRESYPKSKSKSASGLFRLRKKRSPRRHKLPRFATLELDKLQGNAKRIKELLSPKTSPKPPDSPLSSYRSSRSRDYGEVYGEAPSLSRLLRNQEELEKSSELVSEFELESELEFLPETPDDGPNDPAPWKSRSGGFYTTSGLLDLSQKHSSKSRSSPASSTYYSDMSSCEGASMTPSEMSNTKEINDCDAICITNAYNRTFTGTRVVALTCSDCEFRGDRSIVFGDYNYVYSEYSTVVGNHNMIYCKNCTVKGSGNRHIFKGDLDPESTVVIGKGASPTLPKRAKDPEKHRTKPRRLHS